MIQIYIPENTNFEMNGDKTLTPLLAEVSATLNDLWCASLKHPIDQEGRWKFITEDAVVKMPSFNGEQLFRIRNVYKSDSSVECSMEPIFYDSIDDCFIEDIRPTGLKGQLALNAMLAPNEKYKATSDVKKISTAYYQDMNFMEALNGDIDQSFINRWGGEILYDNFTVIVNERVGSDKGVELRYGKNIKKNGLSEKIDTRSVVTRIKPKAYNGYTMTGSFVDSPYIDKYPTIRTRTMKFDDVKMVADAMDGDEKNGVIICNTQEELDAALRLKCEEQYELGLDKPKVTIHADMVLLQNTEEYKEFSGLEQVSLGDTIHCIHDVLGIVSDARIVSLKYDSIKEKVTSVTIGDFKHDYFDQLSSSTGRIESEVQNLIDQIENPNSEFQKSMQKLIDEMASSISGNDGGNMVITQNSNGKPNGIMIMDTDSKETAKKILYFNLNGISYSNNGVNGPYNAVWSFEKGGFSADWIVTGNMIADVIKGGTLTIGGNNNEDGVLEVFNSNGKKVGTWNKDGINATSGEIAGWTVNSSQIIKFYNIYTDMTENGLSSVGDYDPVQYVVFIRIPNSSTTPVFFVGYRKKTDYLNNTDSWYPYFRVLANGYILANNLSSSNISITGGKIKIKSSNNKENIIDFRSETSNVKTKMRITPDSIDIFKQFSTGEKYWSKMDGEGVSVGTFEYDIFDDSHWSTSSKVHVLKSGIYDGNAYTGNLWDANGNKVFVSGGIIKSVTYG